VIPEHFLPTLITPNWSRTVATEMIIGFFADGQFINPSDGKGDDRGERAGSTNHALPSTRCNRDQWQ
jgi:hypothetical protein